MDDDMMDLRVVETYIPAFFTIMKTIAVLGFIPFMGWVGLSNNSVYNLVGTLLFVDRMLFAGEGLGHGRRDGCGGARGMDSN
eukprot:748786-Hanusia_phi.AAC.1